MWLMFEAKWRWNYGYKQTLMTNRLPEGVNEQIALTGTPSNFFWEMRDWTTSGRKSQCFVCRPHLGWETSNLNSPRDRGGVKRPNLVNWFSIAWNHGVKNCLRRLRVSGSVAGLGEVCVYLFEQSNLREWMNGYELILYGNDCHPIPGSLTCWRGSGPFFDHLSFRWKCLPRCWFHAWLGCPLPCIQTIRHPHVAESHSWW